jgi:hypothetical protein
MGVVGDGEDMTSHPLTCMSRAAAALYAHASATQRRSVAGRTAAATVVGGRRLLRRLPCARCAGSLVHIRAATEPAASVQQRRRRRRRRWCGEHQTPPQPSHLSQPLYNQHLIRCLSWREKLSHAPQIPCMSCNAAAASAPAAVPAVPRRARGERDTTRLTQQRARRAVCMHAHPRCVPAAL